MGNLEYLNDLICASLDCGTNLGSYQTWVSICGGVFCPFLRRSFGREMNTSPLIPSPKVTITLTRVCHCCLTSEKCKESRVKLVLCNTVHGSFPTVSQTAFTFLCTFLWGFCTRLTWLCTFDDMSLKLGPDYMTIWYICYRLTHWNL